MPDLIFECSQCHNSLAASGEMQGTTTTCPKCQAKVQVPIRLQAPVQNKTSPQNGILDSNHIVDVYGKPLQTNKPPQFSQHTVITNRSTTINNIPTARSKTCPVNDYWIAFIAAFCPLLYLIQYVDGLIFDSFLGWYLDTCLGCLWLIAEVVLPIWSQRLLKKDGFNIQPIQHWTRQDVAPVGYWHKRAKTVGSGKEFAICHTVLIVVVVLTFLLPLLLRAQKGECTALLMLAPLLPLSIYLINYLIKSKRNTESANLNTTTPPTTNEPSADRERRQ